MTDSTLDITGRKFDNKYKLSGYIDGRLEQYFQDHDGDTFQEMLVTQQQRDMLDEITKPPTQNITQPEYNKFRLAFGILKVKVK